MNFQGGIVLLKNIFRIIINFKIFPNDHLLDGRCKVFTDENNWASESLIPNAMKELRLYEVIL